MTTLLLDIGNTRAKAAWLGADSSVGAVSNYEFGNEPLSDWLDHLTLNQATDMVWASNVGGDAPANALRDWAREQNTTVQFVQSRSKQLGVRCAYANPTRLGVDRWMVVLAAAARKTNCLIVDAGTACTIDAVDATGQHLGGLILPGVRLARSALNQRTNFQADDVATDPLPVLGDDTNPAVTLGAVHALLGAIDRVCAGLGWADFDGLLTGGEASVLAPHLDATWVQQPDLVLQGVARVACQDEADLG